MTEVVLPDLALRPVTFTVDDETVRADEDLGPAAAQVATGLPARVSLGGPFAVPVTAGMVKDDDDLRVFAAAEAGVHAYHLVHLAATFTSAPGDPPFASAEIELLLSASGTGPDAADPPVAWSMQPQRVTDDQTAETTWKFGPELTLEGVGVKLGSVEHTRTRTVPRVAVEALRLLQPDPGWRVSATTARPVAGTYRFVLVVRARHAAAVHLFVTMRTTVRQRSLLHYRSVAQPPIVLAADL
jgi:hypothetical protein